MILILKHRKLCGHIDRRFIVLPDGLVLQLVVVISVAKTRAIDVHCRAVVVDVAHVTNGLHQRYRVQVTLRLFPFHGNVPGSCRFFKTVIVAL